MKPLFSNERVNRYFEAIVVGALQLLLMVVIVIAVADLWFILGTALFDERLSELRTVPDLQRALQRTLAGVLLVLLGLEMMSALRTYFSEHSVKVEIILILALIAVGRHIIQLDIEHLDGVRLIGMAVLIIGLAAGLAMIRGLHPWRYPSPPTPQTDSAVPQTTENPDHR
jgi:uncharacterized membrane protein (DUF373 family)